ncbi:thioredoxin domain-containing protein [Eisenibacter elegans]|jgi:thiol-disulfide isomerase/thioredoxin|uniref:thioredoxin domain-containing protein n=1 Tax=Eisenibacter elegans TaxID=997 RepID=UPI0004137E0A|nr:thioredoxin domain-containing protein [Eisenibacter elegans]
MLNLFQSKKKEVKKVLQTQLLVLYIHADWCENGKTMQTRFDQLRNKFDGQEVLFVKLDYTNNTTKHQSALLGIALGLRDVLERAKGTGFMLVVSAKSLQVLNGFNHKKNLSEMIALVEANLQEVMAS